MPTREQIARFLLYDFKTSAQPPSPPPPLPASPPRASTLRPVPSVCFSKHRDDLLEFCLDQVAEGFDEYLTSTNGNPLVYDTVRVFLWLCCCCCCCTHIELAVSSPWPQDRLQSLWSGRTPHGKKHKQTKSGTRMYQEYPLRTYDADVVHTRSRFSSSSSSNYRRGKKCSSKRRRRRKTKNLPYQNASTKRKSFPAMLV